MTEAAFETASWLRRILALFVDWLVSTFVVIALVGLDEYTETGAVSYLVLVCTSCESAVLTWLAAGSFGKLVTGLRVVPVDGRVRPLNPLKVLARQVLIVLVIPPLVFRHDGRGLHDMFAGTATVTMPTFRALLAGADASATGLSARASASACPSCWSAPGPWASAPWGARRPGPGAGRGRRSSRPA